MLLDRYTCSVLTVNIYLILCVCVFSDDELDLFKLLPTLSKGARSSFLTSSSSGLDLQPSLVKPHLDPRQSNVKSSHPNVVWNATHGFKTNPDDGGGGTTTADDVPPKTKGSSLLQLTDGDGDSTPVKDEGRSTPVMDEKPDGAAIAANPIEFLTQLISRGRKDGDGTPPSSFMQSLSVLTSSVSAQFQSPSDGNDSPADASMSSPGVTVPSSWKAWKAKLDPSAPAENGTPPKKSSVIPQPIPPPVAPPVNFSRPMVPRFPQAPSRPSAPPSYSPSRGPFDPAAMRPMSSPLPVPPPPRMPIFPQQPRPVAQSPVRGMWQPVPPMFPPGSIQPPRPPGAVSPAAPFPTQSMRQSLPRLMLHTAPGGSVPSNFNPFPTPDGQTSVGVNIPTVGGSQPQRPQFPPPPQQPTSPFGAPAPVAPVHVTSPTAVEDEQNEFIRKLKRKSSISTIPITPPTPPVGILKSMANSNLRTLTQVQTEEAILDEELGTSSILGGDEMELGSSIQTIQSVHMSPNSEPPMMGPQDFEYKPDEFRPPNTYKSGNRHYNQYQRPHDGHRHEEYRRGFQEDAFQRDSYGRLPPKRPPPKFEQQGGYYQRY